MLVGSAVFAVGAASASQLTLDWVDNAGGTANFAVERKTGTTGTYARVATTGTGITTYADSAVVAGTTYCYRVKASNAFGDSGYSNAACGSAAAGFALTVAKAGTGSGTVVSTPSGINCGGDCVETYAAGRIVTLTATPASGSFFSGWSGGECAGTHPCVMAGNTPVTVTATFSLDRTAPTATITSPASGTSVSGSVNVTVNAADNVAVTRVELWVDGAPVATGTAAPWSLAWDSTVKPNGAHSLLAKAYDAAGNVGSSTSISVTVNNSQMVSSPAMTLVYNGKLRDRVGQGNTPLAPDGALDGTLTVTLNAPGGRTVTGLQLDSDAPGIWGTSGGNAWWVLGVATTPDGSLLNAPGATAVKFSVAEQGSFVVFASDYQASEFLPGRTLTLTATFADGSTATAVTTVP